MSSLQVKDGSYVFSDSVTVQSSAEDAYRLLWEVECWPDLLPHVEGIRMLEQTEAFQRFEMTTKGPTGVHVTESIREGAAPEEIRYRQITLPQMLTEHSGRWLLTEGPKGVEVVAEHTIRIDEETIEETLGRPYSRDEAALLSRHFIGNHSASTLRIIKKSCEDASQGEKDDTEKETKP